MGSWITDTIVRTGYFGVLLLAFVESVFPPIPSELILPLGGYLASKGQMAMAGVIAAGTLGSVLGALLLYWVGQRIGEPRLKRFADRHGRWLALSRQDIDRASAWFDRRGAWAVFGCRMIPGLRSLISIPAGIHRMPLPTFLLVTALGSLLWSALLVWLGFALGANFEQVGKYIDPVSMLVMGVLLVVYVWRVATHKDPVARP